MTNEEKAINILQQFGIIAKDLEDERRSVVIEYCKNHIDYNMLLEMAAWKEQQMIEKTCEWLTNAKIGTFPYKLVEDFRKAMEE